jgi:hypothetical protein
MVDRQRALFYTVGVLMITAITFWGVKFNTGNLVVTGPTSGFQVLVDGQEYECTGKCDLELKPRAYEIEIKKENYNSLNRKVFLTRGENEKVLYSPTFKPTFENTDYEAPDKNFGFVQDDNLLFQVNGLTVSTFREELKSPKATLSIDQKFAFIWSDQSVVDYYLIDVANQTRTKIKLDNSNYEFQNPTKFRLLTKDLLLLETDKLYFVSLKEKIYKQIPAKTVEHAGYINNKLVFLTNQSLTSDEDSAISQLTTLIDKDENEIGAELNLNPSKLYSYDLESNTYEFLSELPEQLNEPYIIWQDEFMVLTTQEDSFVIRFSEN